MTTAPEPAFTLAPEDIDPRRLQRLLLGAFALAAIAAWLYALTAKRARDAELAADAAEVHALELRAAALGLGQSLADARDVVERARTELAAGSPATTTTETTTEGGSDAA